MSILYPTALSRLVNNEWEKWKDQVLYELFTWHHSIWNSDDSPLSVTGLLEKPELEKLGSRTVSDICRKLEQEGLIERVHLDQDFYRLTPSGIEYIEKELTKGKATSIR